MILNSVRFAPFVVKTVLKKIGWRKKGAQDTSVSQFMILNSVRFAPFVVKTVSKFVCGFAAPSAFVELSSVPDQRSAGLVTDAGMHFFCSLEIFCQFRSAGKLRKTFFHKLLPIHALQILRVLGIDQFQRDAFL